jgi:uncharacterized protein
MDQQPARAAEGTARPIVRTRFEIPSAGGPPVRGDLRVLSGHRARDAVVVCHGFKGFREWGTFPHLARAIAASGRAAVTFDFSHNGVGADGVDFSALELFAAQTHSRNVEEIRRVLDVLSSGALLDRPARRLGLLGHSRGGAEAILATAEDPRVDALVTWAAVADIPARWAAEQVERWSAGETAEILNARTGQVMPVGPEGWRDYHEHRERLEVLAAAARVVVPWLIVHGDADASVPVEDGRSLFDAAGEAAELLVVEGGDHTFGARHPWAGATPELRTVAEASLAWFDEHLG